MKQKFIRFVVLASLASVVMGITGVKTASTNQTIYRAKGAGTLSNGYQFSVTATDNPTNDGSGVQGEIVVRNQSTLIFHAYVYCIHVVGNRAAVVGYIDESDVYEDQDVTFYLEDNGPAGKKSPRDEARYEFEFNCYNEIPDPANQIRSGDVLVNVK